MDKKKLRKLPIQKADESDIALGRSIPMVKSESHFDFEKHKYVNEMVPSVKYIVRVKEEDNLLVTYTFKTAEIKKGIIDPYFVSFFDRKSGEDMSLKRSDKGYKWSSASFERELEYPMFPVPSEQETVMNYFENDGSSPMCKIRLFQAAFREKNLSIKHKKETDIIDSVMNQIGPAPGGLEHWAYSEALKPAFIYENLYEGKSRARKTRVSCTGCGGSGIINKDKALRHRGNYICPFCKAKVEGIAAGKIPSGWTRKDAKLAVLEKIGENTFIWRYFWAYEIVYVKTKIREKHEVIEEGRDIVELGSDGNVTYTRYEKMQRKGSYRWWPSPDNGCRVRWSPLIAISGLERYAYDSIVYPASVKNALSDDSRFRYFPLDLQIKAMPKAFYEFALEAYLIFPGIEKLIKIGLYNIASYLLQHDSKEVDEKGGTLLEILKLKNRNELSLLKKFDSIDVLSYIHSAIEHVYTLSENDIRLRIGLDSAYNHASGSLAIIHDAKIDTRKFYNYMMRSVDLTEIRKNEYKHLQFIRDYADYVKDLNFLGIPVTAKNAYPSDLAKTHEAIRLQVKAKEKLIELGRLKKLNRQIENAARRIERKLIKAGLTKGTAAGTFLLKGNDSLCITLPHSKSDLSVEGSQLGHCVGSSGYDMRIVDGESLIIFLRKTSAPEKSYYTMEYSLKDKKIVQCRTTGDGSFDSLKPEAFEGKNAIYRSVQVTEGGTKLSISSKDKLKKLVKYDKLPSSDKKLAELLISEIVTAGKGIENLSKDDTEDLRKLHIDKEDYVEKISGITDKSFSNALTALKNATAGRLAVLDFSKKLEKTLAKVA